MHSTLSARTVPTDGEFQLTQDYSTEMLDHMIALNVRGEMDVSIDIPTPSAPPFGDPRMTGYFILVLLALVGIGASFIQRLRRI